MILIIVRMMMIIIMITKMMIEMITRIRDNTIVIRIIVILY